METAISGTILAIVTTQKDKVASGIPVFFAKDQKKSRYLHFIKSSFKAMTHDLENEYTF